MYVVISVCFRPCSSSRINSADPRDGLCRPGAVIITWHSRRIAALCRLWNDLDSGLKQVQHSTTGGVNDCTAAGDSLSARQFFCVCYRDRKGLNLQQHGAGPLSPSYSADSADSQGSPDLHLAAQGWRNHGRKWCRDFRIFSPHVFSCNGCRAPAISLIPPAAYFMKPLFRSP